MGTSWDRAAERYLDVWVPRFLPYHADLVRELAPRPGERILVTSVGPGAELLPLSRALEGGGALRGTDPSAEMIELARRTVVQGELAMEVELAVGEAHDVDGGPWDAIVNAFGLWQIGDRPRTLARWRDALAPEGRVAVVTWGPSDDDGAHDALGAALREIDPGFEGLTRLRDAARRETMRELFDAAGLEMIRHTVVRHTMTFGSAAGFFHAMADGCTFRRVVDELGPERTLRLEAAFYGKLGRSGDLPLVVSPAASVVLARRR